MEVDERNKPLFCETKECQVLESGVHFNHSCHISNISKDVFDAKGTDEKLFHDLCVEALKEVEGAKQVEKSLDYCQENDEGNSNNKLSNKTKVLSVLRLNLVQR